MMTGNGLAKFPGVPSAVWGNARDALWAHQGNTQSALRINTKDAVDTAPKKPGTFAGLTNVVDGANQQVARLAIVTFAEGTELNLAEAVDRVNTGKDDPTPHAAVLPLIAYDPQTVRTPVPFAGQYTILGEDKQPIPGRERQGNPFQKSLYSGGRLTSIIDIQPEEMTGWLTMAAPEGEPRSGLVQIAGILVTHHQAVLDTIKGQPAARKPHTFQELTERSDPHESRVITPDDAKDFAWLGAVPARAYIAREANVGMSVIELAVDPDTAVPVEKIGAGLSRTFHVSEGTGSFVIDGVEHAVTPGDVIVVTPGTEYTFSGTGLRMVMHSTSEDNSFRSEITHAADNGLSSESK